MPGNVLQALSALLLYVRQGGVALSYDACVIEGCTRKVRTRGYCRRCLQAGYEDGSIPKIRGPRGECTVDSCSDPATSKKMCGNSGCGGTEELGIDHDHSCCSYTTFNTKYSCGNCVRGWLCRGCNVALGHLQENPDKIRGLVTYLENSRR